MHNILLKTENILKLRNYSPKTRKAYLFYIKDYITYAKKNGLTDKKEAVENYLLERHHKGQSPQTVNLALNAIKFFYKEVFKKNTKSDNQDTIQILEKLFNYRRVKIIGSVALDYAYVAAGRAQAAVIKNEDGFTALAGQLLVEEAGGKFTDFDGKKYTFGASGAVASQGVGHSKIINMTKSSLRKL